MVDEIRPSSTQTETLSSPNQITEKDENTTSTPTTKSKKEIDTENNNEHDKYNNIILDTSAIIHSGGIITSYLEKTKNTKLHTVSGVIKELRDSKSRQAFMDDTTFLSHIIIREPNKTSMNVITNFAKKSGDYHHLSLVDMQLMALTYELEEEGCVDMNHIRYEPKHVIGKGHIELLHQEPENNDDEKKCGDEEKNDGDKHQNELFKKTDNDKDNSDNKSISNSETVKPIPGGSWAHIVNPTIAPHSTPPNNNTEASVDYTSKVLSHININEEELGGQFSDAEEESDTNESKNGGSEKDLEKELKLDFPSLSASLATAEYSDEDEDQLNPLDPTSDKRYNTFRTYRNVINPNGIATKTKNNTTAISISIEEEEETKGESNPVDDSNNKEQEHTSRIMGGTTISGQTAYEEEDDDDEGGWITVDTLQSLKSSGSIHFPSSATKNNKSTTASNTTTKPNTNPNQKKNKLPPKPQRSAIVTTDYAMQNIILQMNLSLLSLNASTTITQLKSWILRCQACFLLLPTQQTDETIPRIFCPKCGNAHTLQRISCKVNANTGRLILFRTKNPKKLNGVVRGMKYSVPKPNKKNRFNGDLLMREDQLFYGIWKQKIKTNHTTLQQDTVFGSDVLDSVGLMDNAAYKKHDYSNIHAGFGRRNVNATKQGRERRGKKKKKNGKGSDKIVCGMRRTC